MIQSAALSAMSNVSHGFFTRANGTSTGIYAGRNCGLGSDDLRAHVVENRGRVADDLGVKRENLLSIHQTHSIVVKTVTKGWASDAVPKADAMVTDQPGIGLAILTADCTPVLFADETRAVVGAAHAGWKGALGGVLEATLDAMVALGARRNNITATIGPCISQAAYEVGPEFAETFIAKDPTYAAYFIPSARDEHHQFDLTTFTGDRLAAQGLAGVDTLKHCTYADATLFFSYRRTTHAGEPDYGRQMSAISLKRA